MSSFYHIADPSNPHETLALEEALLNQIAPDEILLYLYVHTPSVIIGRAQNAWTECDITRLRELGGTAARRITGGGAVYHDEKNLNFSFICAPGLYDHAAQMNVILSAVRELGVEAEISGRNDILAGGKKFSGNAWLARPNGTIHHGTLMVDTDLGAMQAVLNVPKGKMQSKGVKSVRSRVVNLAELRPGVTVKDLQSALKTSFAQTYGRPEPYQLTDEIVNDAKTLSKRNASWDWIYGKTPGFSAEVSGAFDWGRIEISWTLRNRVLHDVWAYSDALEEGFVRKIGTILENAPFTVNGVAGALEAAAATDTQKTMAADIAGLIMQK